MIREMDLAKPVKAGMRDIEKINIIITYMYVGNTLYHDGRYYRMDGDFNPYIVSLKEDFKTPVDRGEEKMPMFQNEVFWNLLIDMAQATTEDEMEKMKSEVSRVNVLNK